jgi:hypothetical protein
VELSVRLHLVSFYALTDKGQVDRDLTCNGGSRVVLLLLVKSLQNYNYEITMRHQS